MSQIKHIVTVSLNTAIDLTIEVPNFTLNEHQHGRRVARIPSGKGLNVSRALAVLGQANTVMGFVGDNDYAFYDTFLSSDAHRLVTNSLIQVCGRTRENITLMDPVNHTDTHIREQGFTVTRDDLDAMAQAIADVSSPETIVCFCGSVPLGCTAEDFARLVDVAIDRGAKVAIDANGDPLLAVYKKPVWLLKPNLLELEQILGRGVQGEDDLMRAIQGLAQIHDAVIVTRGAEGALYCDSDQVISSVTRPGDIRVAHSIGCGDCVLAGFIDGYVRGESASEALARGLATATANLTVVENATFSRELVAEFEACTETTDVSSR